MLSECIYKVLMASGVVTSSDACDLSGAIEAAVLEAQEKQEPVAWMHWYKYYDGTDVVKVAIGHAPTFNDRSPFRSEPLYAATVVQQKVEPEKGKCSTHPDAPHGFDRNASHNAGRYVCECEGWAPVVPPDMVMVPREPTEAMLNSCWRDYPEAARETWRAMIAAAEWKG